MYGVFSIVAPNLSEPWIAFDKRDTHYFILILIYEIVEDRESVLGPTADCISWLSFDCIASQFFRTYRLLTGNKDVNHQFLEVHESACVYKISKKVRVLCRLKVNSQYFLVESKLLLDFDLAILVQHYRRTSKFF